MAWRWTRLPASGTGPSRRGGHAAAVVDGSLIIAGGWDGVTAFGDAFALDMVSARWRALYLRGNGKLERRMMFAYTAAEDGKKLYVHGGADNRNLATVKSDLIVLDVRQSTLQTVQARGGPMLFRHAMAAARGYKSTDYLTGNNNKFSSVRAETVGAGGVRAGAKQVCPASK